jgi:hypothetical protein
MDKFVCERESYKKLLSENILQLYLIKIIHPEDMLSFV